MGKSPPEPRGGATIQAGRLSTFGGRHGKTLDYKEVSTLVRSEASLRADPRAPAARTRSRQSRGSRLGSDSIVVRACAYCQGQPRLVLAPPPPVATIPGAQHASPNLSASARTRQQDRKTSNSERNVRALAIPVLRQKIRALPQLARARPIRTQCCVGFLGSCGSAA